MDADEQPKSVISLPSSHSDDLMVLRTRVAQQSELISMLKTRSDKTLLEVCKLKEEKEELAPEREAAVCSLERQVQRCRSVEDHFETLRSNHEQMIEIKDQYKQETSALRARLEGLTNGRQVEVERAAELASHGSEVAELRGELEQARCCAATAEDRCRLLESQVECLTQDLAGCREEAEQWRTASAQLEQRLQESCRCAEEAQETVQGVQAQHREQKVEWKQEMCHLTQEVAKLTQEVAKRQETIKEQEAEMNRLESELSAGKGERSKLVAELRQKVEELSGSVAHQELQQLREEFAAYKAHMSSLLEQERGLNRKLRRMIE